MAHTTSAARKRRAELRLLDDGSVQREEKEEGGSAEGEAKKEKHQANSFDPSAKSHIRLAHSERAPMYT